MPKTRIQITERRHLKALPLAVLVCTMLVAACAEVAEAALTYVSPGDSFDNATLLAPGTYANAQPLYGSHFFKLLLSRGTILAAMVQPGPEGDIDLYLYDGFREGVANSTTREQGAAEIAQHVTGVTGYYYVETRFVMGQSNYTLTVDTSVLQVIAADWGTATSPVDAAPGDLGVPLTVKVRNENSFAITDLTATLYLGDFFTSALGGATAIAHHSLPVQPTESFDFVFTLSLGSSTALGSHLLTMALSYYSQTATSTNASLQFNLTVPVQVPGRASFQFALSDLFLQPGTTTTLALAVRNLGTAPAGSSELALTVPPPLALSGIGNRWILGSILPGQETTVLIGLYAPASTQGTTFQVTAALTYRSPTGLSRMEAQTLAVSVPTAPDIQFVVLAEGQSLTAGDVSNLTLTVMNNGTVAANSVDVTLTPSAPLSLVGKDNRWFAPSLAPQEALRFEAAVYAPYTSQGQSYTATVTIGYKTPEGVSKTDLRGIGLTVPRLAADPVLEVAVGGQTLTAGVNNTLLVTLLNRGTAAALSLDVTVSLPPPLVLASRDNHWSFEILEPGASASMPITIYSSPSSPEATLAMALTMSYKTPYGAARTEARSISLKLNQRVGSPLELTVLGQTLTAGAPSNVTLLLLNKGGQDIGPLDVVLSLPAGLTLVGRENRWHQDSLRAGSAMTIMAPVLPPRAALGATYQVGIGLTYKDAGLVYSETKLVTLTATSAATDEPIVRVEAEPSFLIAGDANEVNLTVTNVGVTDASGLEVMATVQPPLTFVASESRWRIQSLKPGQAVLLGARIYAPASGSPAATQLALAVTYATLHGTVKVEQASIGFIVRSAAESEAILSASVTNADLLAGQVNDVSITVSNEGVRPATSLFVTLSTPPGLTILGRSNRWFVPRVEAGGRSVLPVQLFASSAGIGSDSPATLTLRYRDSRSNDVTETSSIGFAVRGYIDLYVMNIVTSPSPAILGRSLIVSGSVLNEGSMTAKAVNISLRPDPESVFTATVASSNFVGEAPVGLQTPFSINVLVGSAVANGTYSLPLELIFKDDRNELRRITTLVPIVVVTEAPLQPGTEPPARGYPVFYIAVAAAAFFALGFLAASILLRRRRRSAARQTIS